MMVLVVAIVSLILNACVAYGNFIATYILLRIQIDEEASLHSL